MPTRDPTAADRWLLIQAHLPAGSSSGRVAIWRRLRKLGAVGLGGACWALPDDAENRESCEWIRRDLAALGGEALLFEARAVDEAVIAALARRARGEAVAPGGTPAATALSRLDPARFRRRTWVTRPRPGVDRMASAWLIRRFVDPAARFEFDAADGGPRGKAIPFDTFGAELGHQQGLCTFEVLARRFGVDDAAVRALARTVHAVDLHEPLPDGGEAALVERLVAGLRATHADDHELLAAGMAMFEALYAAARQERPPRPPRAAKATRRVPARKRQGRRR